MLPNKHRYVTIAFLIAAFLWITVWTAFASPLEERQREQEELNEQIKSQKNELEGLQQQEDNLQSQLQQLNQQIQRLEGEIRKLNQRIAATEEYIAITEEELAEAEAHLELQNNLLKRRLRAIYEHGTVSYIEVLFTANSFGEFLTRMNDLKIIAQNDFHLIEAVQKEKARIEAEKEELEEQRHQLLSMRRENILKKEELDTARVEQKQVLAALQEEIQKQEEAIAALEKEASELEALIKKLIAQMRQPPSRSGDRLLWPLADYQRAWITSGYGYRTNPITGIRRSFHSAIDIGIPRTRWPSSPTYNGNPVYIRATDNGVVAFSGWQIGSGQYRDLPAAEDDRVPESRQWWSNGGYGYGRFVILNHGDGLSTVNGHCYKRLVSTGDYVYRGQPIGIVGSTGWSTGPHLHFEVHENGVKVNPLNYLQ